MSFGSGYKGAKLKTNLRLSINRLKLLEKKKTEMAQKARREIADYIATGKDERARIRVEHIIREDYLVEAMELLELYCDLLLARFGLIESTKTLDDGLAEAISTIIWAAPRMQSDVHEVGVVSQQLCLKYGKEYGKLARANETGTVNERFMLKLSPKPPPKILVERYLQEIARSHNIPYEPDLEVLDSADLNPLTADDLLLLDDTPSKGGPPGSTGGSSGMGGPPPPPGGGFGGSSGGYGGPPGGGYGGGYGGGSGGGGGGGGAAPMVPTNAVPSVGPPNPNMPFAYPSQPSHQNAPVVPPPPAATYSPPPTSKKGGPPPLPSRPPAASAPPPSYNGEVSRNMTPAPPYEDAMRDSVYPPPPGPGGMRPSNFTPPSAPAPTPPPPPSFPDAGPLPGKDAAASIPDLPAVPTNSLPPLDNTVGSQSTAGDDVDFDDLTRRFEELKKRK